MAQFRPFRSLNRNGGGRTSLSVALCAAATASAAAFTLGDRRIASEENSARPSTIPFRHPLAASLWSPLRPRDRTGTPTTLSHPSFPRFTPHHKSLLASHLTPAVYSTLVDLSTEKDTTLEDIISAGVSLPHCGCPPRSFGAICGDAACYDVFAPLLGPMIKNHHGHDVEAGGGHPHPQIGGEERAVASGAHPDPDGGYVLSTRIRAARCLDAFRFPSKCSRSERREIERVVSEALAKISSPDLRGFYLRVSDMDERENEDLILRRILFDNPNEWAVGCGLGRDWPDARGMYVNRVRPKDGRGGDKDRGGGAAVDGPASDFGEPPDFIVWVNEEDHLRIICMRKGGDIGMVYEMLARGIAEIEAEIGAQGHAFARSERYGYLVSCPTNVGTGLRASVHVKLVRLGRKPGFDLMLRRMRLEARGSHGETDRRYTGVFDISNSQRLGRGEVEVRALAVSAMYATFCS